MAQEKPAQGDVLLGTLVGGRYQINERCGDDRFGALFKGVDEQTGAIVGVRITFTKAAHAELNNWLAQARLSPGRDLILAVGHVDYERSFVVFAEVALDTLKPRPPKDDETEDADEADSPPDKDEWNWRS